MAIEILVELDSKRCAEPADGPRKAGLVPRPLPVELHREIVENVDDRATLLALCITSYDFKAEAERMLYGSMTQVLSKADESTNLHLSFLRTVATVRRLAALVHTYHLPNITLWDADVKKEFPYLLRSALQAMINLRELWFGLPMDETGLNSCVLEGCHFQLESFRLGHAHRPEILASFFEGQRRLRQLTVNFSSDAKGLPPAVCPNLEVLQGNRHTIDALLPHLSIKALIYNPDTYEMNEPVSHLAEPLGRLQVLSLGGYYMRPSLQVLAPFLVSLEYLELVSLHSGEIEVVCQLPSLRGLVLTEALSLNAWERRPSLVSSIFSRCPNLQFIDIQKVYFRGCSQPYQRWTLPPGSNVPVFEETLPQEHVRQRFTACSRQ